jgi:DNA-binding NarL/FixJ family response regulator
MHPARLSFISRPKFVPPGAAVLSAEERAGGPAPAEGLRVLVVEDDYLAAADAEAGLNDAGFEVVGVARSAEEAIAIAGAERPALAIMDIRLNGARDGIDAALALFERFGIRSIFATAHHDAAMRARAEPASPLGWLPKPYSMHSLVARVKSAAAELTRGAN